MRILNMMKKIFGHAEYIDTIADNFSNKDIPNGYAGGSLSAKNVLVVTNTEITSDEMDEVFRKEQCCCSLLNIDRIMNVSDITEAAKDLIGPFTHVINVFHDKGERPLLVKNHFNDNDCVYQLYQWLQEEVDYLVKLNQYATVCTVFISESSIDSNVKKKNVEMCIRGLAEVLSNHRMICNGIIANKEISINELLTTTVYLSSRYGQIMTGEVLKLNLSFGKF